MLGVVLLGLGIVSTWGHIKSSAAMLLALFMMTFPSLLDAKMTTASEAMVIANHKQSAQVGLEILKHGGTAADAYIAATFMDYVMSPGWTSMAGPLNVLYREAEGNKVMELFAGLKTPSAEDGLYDGNPATPGKLVLIPGAIAGLEAIHKRYGRLSWQHVLEPAIKQAEEGFTLSLTYAASLAFRAPALYATDYGQNTFFKDGQLLTTGDHLALPVVAHTLRQIANHGAQYFYQGQWAHEMLQVVHAHGGKITAEDLKSYQAQWQRPLTAQYRGHKIYTTSPSSFGGMKSLLSLQVMSWLNTHKLPHWSRDIDSLETMMRVAQEVQKEPWIHDPEVFAQRPVLEGYLADSQLIEAIANRVRRRDSTSAPTAYRGVSSHHVIVIDQEGNIATGTNTIESQLWGDPVLFVGGVPLNSTGHRAEGRANHYILEPFSNHIVFKSDNSILATAAIGSSLFPADIQVLANLIDHNMPPDQALLTPRFGNFVVNFQDRWPPDIDTSRFYLDRRYPQSFVDELLRRGIQVDQGRSGFVDTGTVMALKLSADRQKIQGMAPENLPDASTVGF